MNTDDCSADPAAAWIQSRPVMTAVGSEFAFDTTRNWLEACLKDHPVCCRPEPPHLPTRVIDVGTQRHNDGAVRLHISKPAETYAYATLSYCWGGPQPVLLKAANIDEMTREIPLDPLPQTIKDAIRVTRRLGIRFLWIDALCIIQEGDESDKMHEVGVMSEVYGNSTITIMAASAQSVSEGFLHKRAASSTISLPFYCKSGEIGTVQLIRSQLSRHDLMKPLNRRGWAFQEQILSRRMIIYGEKEQVWCCQTEHCKQFPGSTLTPVLDLSSLPPAAFGAERYILSVGEAQNLWEDLVSEYTKRALSLSEDRLAAVTGVIDSLKPLFQDDCAFGIWHKNFLRQVVWHRNYIETNPGDKKWQEVLSCAPEWSWASRTFPVKFQKDFEPCGKGQEHWKVVADNKAVLTGKLKRGHDMTEEDRNGLISATWDILSPELPRTNFVMNYKNNEMFYLLCGYHSSRRPDGLQKDIITLALERRGDGVYRRLGVVFFDMEVTTFDNEVDQEVVLV